MLKTGEEDKEKRIAELEVQIEKMKCCGNCKSVGDSGVIGCFCYEKEEYVLPHICCEKWSLGDIKKED